MLKNLVMHYIHMLSQLKLENYHGLNKVRPNTIETDFLLVGNSSFEKPSLGTDKQYISKTWLRQNRKTV